MSSLDDLATDIWLNNSTSHLLNNLTDLGHSCTTVTHLPVMPRLQLDNAYTIFRPERPTIPNRILRNMCFLQCAWMGDLLVVKHAGQNLQKIVNIEPEDRYLVDLILKW
jgi:hypothetical protein